MSPPPPLTAQLPRVSHPELTKGRDGRTNAKERGREGGKKGEKGKKPSTAYACVLCYIMSCLMTVVAVRFRDRPGPSTHCSSPALFFSACLTMVVIPAASSAVLPRKSS
jgi:hypothetical protein